MDSIAPFLQIGRDNSDFRGRHSPPGAADAERGRREAAPLDLRDDGGQRRRPHHDPRHRNHRCPRGQGQEEVRPALGQGRRRQERRRTQGKEDERAFLNDISLCMYLRLVF